MLSAHVRVKNQLEYVVNGECGTNKGGEDGLGDNYLD